MKVCIACSAPLDASNRTREHIIPASLGATLWDDAVLCRTCNSKFGQDLDSHLEEILHVFVRLFGVQNARETKPPRDIAYSGPDGRRLRWNPDSSYVTVNDPSFERIEDEDTIRISFEVPADDNAETAIRRHRESIAKKYGAENILHEERDELFEPSPPKTQTMDLHEDGMVLRAVAKIAMMFTTHTFGAVPAMYGALASLRDFVMGVRSEPVPVTAYPGGMIEALTRSVPAFAPPMHVCTAFVHDNIIWCGVALFGVFGFLVQVCELPEGILSKANSVVFFPEERRHEVGAEAIADTIKELLVSGKAFNDVEWGNERYMATVVLGMFLKQLGVQVVAVTGTHRPNMAKEKSEPPEI